MGRKMAYLGYQFNENAVDPYSSRQERNRLFNVGFQAFTMYCAFIFLP